MLPPPHHVKQFSAMCSPFTMLVSCTPCLLPHFFVLIIVQMNESLYDNIVTVDKYVLRRTTKKYSERSNASQQRPLDRLWRKAFTGSLEMTRNFLSSTVNRGEKQSVYGMPCFELCWARQHDEENLCKIPLARVLQRHDF